MKVQVPIIHLVRIFMISRTSTYHNIDYVEKGSEDFLCKNDVVLHVTSPSTLIILRIAISIFLHGIYTK